jgi:hypothetical protein
VGGCKCREGDDEGSRELHFEIGRYDSL